MKDLNLQNQNFINHSKQNYINQNNYLKLVPYYFNKKTGEIIELKKDIKQDYKNYYLWITQNSINIEKQALKRGFNGCFFITITLDSEYHKYKKINNKYVLNDKYNKENTINKGYKLLNNTFRNITKQAHKDLKKDNIRFLKVIERHKDNTPHLHAIIFFNEKNTKKIEKIIKNKIKFKGYKNTNKGIKLVGSDGIGLTDLQLINKKERGAAYLLKYLKKTYNNSNLDSLHLLDGWKKDNKIRILTYSQSKKRITKKVFNKVNKYVPKEIKKEHNTLTWLNYNITINYYKNNEKETIIKNNNSYFFIDVYKEKSQIRTIKHNKNYKNFSINFNKMELINKFLDEDNKQLLNKQELKNYYKKQLLKNLENKNIEQIKEYLEYNISTLYNIKDIEKIKNYNKNFYKNIDYIYNNFDIKEVKKYIINQNNYNGINEKLKTHIEKTLLKDLKNISWNFENIEIKEDLKDLLNELENTQNIKKLIDINNKIIDYVITNNTYKIKIKYNYTIKKIVINDKDKKEIYNSSNYVLRIDF